MTSVHPPEFTCPISMDLMKDPVITPDGMTFDREPLTEWVKRNHSHPITRELLSLDQIKPNYALRSLIESYNANPGTFLSNQVPVATVAASPYKFMIEYDEHKQLGSIMCDDGAIADTVLIAVIDTSGSMAMDAMNKDMVNKYENFNLSRIELVKQSLQTVVKVLETQPNTSMSLIGFSDYANVFSHVDLVKGKQSLLQMINELNTGGLTNIWDGLNAALKEAKRARITNPNANIHIMLLTDGEPSMELSPPIGIVETFAAAYTNNNITLSTFGFGYSLDTSLLRKLSERGGGIYGYIPDCSMVGTVFINYCSNILSTVAINVYINDINIGKLRMGIPAYFSGYLMGDTVNVSYNGITSEIEISHTEFNDDGEAEKIIIKTLTEIVSNVYSEQKFTNLLTTAKASIEALYSSEFTKGVIDDIDHIETHKGQLMKAVQSRANYIKWGLNHIVSYLRALQTNYCVNFKDAAIQTYKSARFMELQELGNKIFNSIPVHNITARSNFSVNNAVPLTMNIFNAEDGGCFTGDSIVEMVDGEIKRVDNIRKGDILANGYKVKCVVRRKKNKDCKMVKLSEGLTITPWHPIKVNDKWEFPCLYTQTVEMVNIEYFYDFVLESGHIAKIGGFNVVTLGHGFTGEVVEHEYFGTSAIIDDLEKEPGYDIGLIDY